MLSKIRNFSLALLTLSGVYLYALPSATIPYLALVLFHIAAGFGLAILLLLRLRDIRTLGWVLIAAGAALGIILTFTGGARPFAPWLYAHIFVCAIGVVLLAGRRPARALVMAAVVIAIGG